MIKQQDYMAFFSEIEKESLDLFITDPALLVIE